MIAKTRHSNAPRLLLALLSSAVVAIVAFVPRNVAVVRRIRRSNIALASSTLQRDELPDYGKTSVKVDEHVLEERHRQWQRKDLFGSTLIDQTLQELQDNPPEPRRTIAESTKEERSNRRRALDNLGIPSFRKFVIDKTDQAATTFERKLPEIFQLNIGLYCNQACGHCHVESSPLRTEMMTAETAARCLELLTSSPSITTLDITGGAPELNANFRYLVEMTRQLRPDIDIIDRCNLTVLQEPGQDDLVDFLKKNRVHVVASLPCYTATNVDKQRGRGVFDRSIAALLALNEAGYGRDPSLQIDLVYNPLGGYLPPAQKELEVQYKKELQENFGVLFNSLFTITNMPIKRFADFLHQRDELQEYMELLIRNFNTNTLDGLMCRDTINVGYDGKIYDCDFNQQLGYTVGESATHKDGISIFDIASLTDLQKYLIRTDNHCFGCTSGMGSSCQGTTA